MDERSVPTKLTERKDGAVEAVFDMLGALVADAKLVGKFDGTAVTKEPEVRFKLRGLPPQPSETPQRMAGAGGGGAGRQRWDTIREGLILTATSIAEVLYEKMQNQGGMDA